jgi:hypothetical protein
MSKVLWRLPGQEFVEVDVRAGVGVALPGEQRGVLVEAVQDHEAAAGPGGRRPEHGDLVVQAAGGALAAHADEQRAVEVLGLGHAFPGQHGADRGVLRSDVEAGPVDVGAYDRLRHAAPVRRVLSVPTAINCWQRFQQDPADVAAKGLRTGHRAVVGNLDEDIAGGVVDAPGAATAMDDRVVLRGQLGDLERTLAVFFVQVELAALRPGTCRGFRLVHSRGHSCWPAASPRRMPPGPATLLSCTSPPIALKRRWPSGRVRMSTARSSIAQRSRSA